MNPGDVVEFTDWNGATGTGKVRNVEDGVVHLWSELMGGGSREELWAHLRSLPVDRVREAA